MPVSQLPLLQKALARLQDSARWRVSAWKPIAWRPICSICSFTAATEFGTHDRIYLPGDWMRSAGVAPEDLAAPKAGPGLRAVLDRMLDRIEPIFSDAFLTARSIAEPDLRQTAITEIAERRRLARRLRRSDPLTGAMGLTALDRAVVWLQLRFRRREPT